MFKSTIGEAKSSYFDMNSGTATSGLTEWDAFKVVLRGQCIGVQWNMCKQMEEELT